MSVLGGSTPTCTIFFFCNRSQLIVSTGKEQEHETYAVASVYIFKRPRLQEIQWTQGAEDVDGQLCQVVFIHSSARRTTNENSWQIVDFEFWFHVLVWRLIDRRKKNEKWKMEKEFYSWNSGSIGWLFASQWKNMAPWRGTFFSDDINTSWCAWYATQTRQRNKGGKKKKKERGKKKEETRRGVYASVKGTYRNVSEDKESNTPSGSSVRSLAKISLQGGSNQKKYEENCQQSRASPLSCSSSDKRRERKEKMAKDKAQREESKAKQWRRAGKQELEARPMINTSPANWLQAKHNRRHENLDALAPYKREAVNQRRQVGLCTSTYRNSNRVNESKMPTGSSVRSFAFTDLQSNDGWK